MHHSHQVAQEAEVAFLSSRRTCLEAQQRYFPYLGPAPPQKCVGDFCCINYGGFCWGFSWRIFSGHFSHKDEEKKSSEKIREKIGGPKIKIRKKSVLPKTDPNISRDACSEKYRKTLSCLFYGVSHNYRAISCKIGYRTDVPV